MRGLQAWYRTPNVRCDNNLTFRDEDDNNNDQDEKQETDEQE